MHEVKRRRSGAGRRRNMPRIAELVERHERLRTSGVNLIASENAPSEAVRKALASDLGARYHSEWYGGTAVVREIVAETARSAREVFRCSHAIVTPISGNVCDLGVILALTRPGDSVAMVPASFGGYPLDVGLFGRSRIDLPMLQGTYEIDVRKLGGLEGRPSLVIAGSSFIPFPHPLRELREIGGRLVYDASHVLGLVATGRFQDPLAEGAEVMFGSTHKSFYGPQGGIVLTNDAELHARLAAVLDFGLEGGIGLVDNPNPARIAALGIALEEIGADGSYGARVTALAAALAAELDRMGVPVRFRDRGCTRSHQVFLDVDVEKGKRISRRLEGMGIFIDIAGRMGTAEAARRGMSEGGMRSVAAMIAAAWAEESGPGRLAP